MRLIGVGKAPSFGVAFDGSAVDFLEEDNVGTGLCDPLTHGFQHKAPVATAVTLVDIVSENVNLARHA